MIFIVLYYYHYYFNSFLLSISPFFLLAIEEMKEFCVWVGVQFYCLRFVSAVAYLFCMFIRNLQLDKNSKVNKNAQVGAIHCAMKNLFLFISSVRRWWWERWGGNFSLPPTERKRSMGDETFATAWLLSKFIYVSSINKFIIVLSKTNFSWFFLASLISFDLLLWLMLNDVKTDYCTFSPLLKFHLTPFETKSAEVGASLMLCN